MDVTLKNLTSDTIDEIAEQYGSSAQHPQVKRAYEVLANGKPARVTCLAVDYGDAAHSYFDIECPNGQRFEAVSGYHLKGVEQWWKGNKGGQ